MKAPLSEQEKQQMGLSRCWLEIDLDLLEKNVRFLRAQQRGKRTFDVPEETGAEEHGTPGVCTAEPEQAVMTAVIKADAYGHGAAVIARFLSEEGLAERFAVASVDEALELRRAGLREEIEILSLSAPRRYVEIIEHALTPVISSEEEARCLSATARDLGKTCRVHLALDTGMHRVGLNIKNEFERSLREAVEIASLPGLELLSCLTHFPKADAAEADEESMEAYRLFLAFTEELHVRSGRKILRHCANSAFFLRLAPRQLDFYRPGIVIYGLLPDACEQFREEVLPIAEFKAEICYVKDLPAGEELSYGGTYRLPRQGRIATVACGYADGYTRARGGKTYVTLEDGSRAPVRGRVCMDAFMIELPADSEIGVGHEVTLYGGKGPELSRLAELEETIHYELACRISSRVPRLYFRHGKPYAIQKKHSELIYFS